MAAFKKKKLLNPYANRFDKPSKKEKTRFPRVAYVMQGGGSLGAYQFGVVKGLLAAGYEPDWIAATSIGALQAAIIVGNPPEKRIQQLQEFWHRIAPAQWSDWLAHEDNTLNLYNKICAGNALLWGQPHFFTPNWLFGKIPWEGNPATLSYYDTSALRETLLDLIDFELLNSCPIRLSLGAVQVRTGHLIYFNNINYRIEVEHVMASGALPPGFPAIDIEGEYYWDGGVHSNSPLEVILEAIPAENTLCFLVDCFGGPNYLPTTMSEVEERRKDISYGTHAQRTIYNYLERQYLRNIIAKVGKHLSGAEKEGCLDLLKEGSPHHCTLVHFLFGSRLVKAGSKDYNFGHKIIKRRMKIGLNDVQATLKEEKEWGYLPKQKKSRLYESPNNPTSLLHKIRKEFL